MASELLVLARVASALPERRAAVFVVARARAAAFAVVVARAVRIKSHAFIFTNFCKISIKNPLKYS
jgi:hypothetical protein